MKGRRTRPRWAWPMRMWTTPCFAARPCLKRRSACTRQRPQAAHAPDVWGGRGLTPAQSGNTENPLRRRGIVVCAACGRLPAQSRAKAVPVPRGRFCTPLCAVAVRPVLTPVCALRRAHFKAQLAQLPVPHPLRGSRLLENRSFDKMQGQGHCFPTTKGADTAPCPEASAHSRLKRLAAHPCAPGRRGYAKAGQIQRRRRACQPMAAAAASSRQGQGGFGRAIFQHKSRPA